MKTKEFVIDDETMEALKARANREGTKLEDLVDRYINLIKGLQNNLPPEFKELQRRNAIAFGSVTDFNWKEELSNELYKKYVG